MRGEQLGLSEPVPLEIVDEVTPNDFSSYSEDGLIVRLPEGLKGGAVKFTIENFGADRYSKPVSKTFVLQPGS